MAHFCTGCGAQSDGDARFCEECGKAMAPPMPPNSVATAPTLAISGAGRRRSRLFIGISLVVLMIGAGATYWLLRDPAPPSPSDITALINSNKSGLDNLICLDNFDYAIDPVYVSASDTQTRSWLSMLVGAGMYTGPTEEVLGGGLFSQQRMRYEHTDNGKKAVRGKKLCFAEGITVDSVHYEEPQSNAKPQRIVGQAKYHYLQPAQWIGTPSAKQAVPARFGQDSLSLPVIFLLLDGKWQPLNSETQAQFRKQAQQQQRSAWPLVTTGSFVGLFSWLGNLFGGSPGSALQGRWLMNQGIARVTFEFKPESAIIMGEEMAVTYSQTGDTILVTNVNRREAEPLKVKIISNNELSITDGIVGTLRLTRDN